jgi:hypothetical protein
MPPDKSWESFDMTTARKSPWQEFFMIPFLCGALIDFQAMITWRWQFCDCGATTGWRLRCEALQPFPISAVH